MKYNLDIKKIILLLVGVVLIQSCKRSIDAPVENAIAPATANIVQLTDAQFKNAEIQVSNPEKMMIGKVIHLNGKIEVMPENMITVSSPMAGFVRQIKWMPGMTVSKGQSLVRLEEKEYIQLQQDYLSAKTSLKFAKQDYERQSELSKSQAASDKILQQAEEKMKQHQITLMSLGEKLKLIHINPADLTTENITSQMVISSPVAGTITDVFVNSGKYVQAGDEMIKMIDNNGFRLVLKAFEKDLPYLRAGLKMVISSNSNPENKMNGRVEFIVKAIGEEGFANVICTFEDKPTNVLPGMYMKAEIETASIDSWTVPDESLVNFEGKVFVFFENGSQRYEMLEVSPGQKENDRTQIINYQNFMDKKVVTKGAYTLLMKMKNVAE